jgi:hypothetical protein
MSATHLVLVIPTYCFLNAVQAAFLRVPYCVNLISSSVGNVDAMNNYLLLD